MKTRLVIAALPLLLAAGSVPAQTQNGTGNRADQLFGAASPLPYHAPQFDKIKDSDFQPGIEAGMTRQLAEIAAITADKSPATFANTLEAMEKSGQMLTRVSDIFFDLTQANTNPALQAAETALAPKLAAHHDAIFMNAALFARVKAVWDARANLKLSPEALQLLTVTYQQFVHSGALLNDADQKKLKALNAEDSTLQTKYNHQLLAAAKAGALVEKDVKKLDGLSAAEIAAAGNDAKERKLPGQYVLPLQNTTQQPALAELTDRATREKLFRQSWTRAEKNDANDTRATIARLAMIRAQKAQLLGYPNYAAYTLYDQMAKTPQAVEKFMAQLVPATLAQQKRDTAALQSIIDKEGGKFAIQPWDWDFYAQKLRKAQYDLDDNEIKPYFELNTVLTDGLFFAANKLYGLTFKERKDIPVWQADVRVFEVFDNGKPLGLMYFDYFKRDNKSGGAWMSNLVEQSHLLGNQPVIFNVTNFTKPAPGQPALITFDDVTTMFHEFGHALHGFFGDQRYPSLSGTAVARDFVEFPSQFNEHWALEPTVFAHYAHHYKTHAPMPDVLVAKIKKASKFNQGYALGELLAAAELDMQWHGLAASEPKKDVDAFESAALSRMGLDTAHVPPRYRSSYFLHIWANGYSAGYYAYLWTEMLEDDIYAWFMAHGGMTRANGQRLRDLVLSRGHSQDYGPMFRAFYGKDPDIGPMLKERGLAN